MCESTARADHTVSAITLHVDSDNKSAQALYTALGYTTIRKGDSSGWEALTGIGENAPLVLMMKVL